MSDVRRYKPQLASSTSVDHLASLESVSRFVVGEKLDGYRELIYFHNDRTELIARSGADHSANALHISGVGHPSLAGTVIDCEAVAPSGLIGDVKSILGSSANTAAQWQKANGLLRLVAVDMLQTHGDSIVHIPFSVRRQLLESVMKELDSNFMLERLITIDKVAFYKSVIVRGGEGVVIKDLDGHYEQGKRRWLKLKKSKTWDVVVVDFSQGQGKYADTIGALVYGAYEDDKLVTVGSTSGMTDEERYQFGDNPQAYIGKVVVIEGMEIGAQGAIRHPRLLGFREDKLPSECVVETLV